MKYAIALLYSLHCTNSFVMKWNVSVIKRTKLKLWDGSFKKAGAAIDKDIIVIGGGIAGLSIALELGLKHNRRVTVLEKSSYDKQGKNGSGSFAAAGMLAPQSERLPLGPLLDCCYASRQMYADFVSVVEGLAGGEVGYRSKGGFIAPAFAGDSVSSWAPPQGYGPALWLDHIQVKSLEPELHPDVIGGWWFPEDTSVDARRLTSSLVTACQEIGVDICFGDGFAVHSLDLHTTGVRTADGNVYKANKLILANGSWMRDLLPVPIIPHKGQSMSLKPPNPNTPPLLNRVLFAQDTYICPKSDGRIIIGATVEPGSFDTSVTTGGIMHIMTAATGLIPALKNYVIEETWAGLRPTTPDKAPILGKTPWDNLIIAGGYWRNGILLAPKTAQLVADLVTDNLSEKDQTFIDAFAWDRFLTDSTKLALQSKYASSVHPLQYPHTNAIVGNELGFYSDATVAKQERQKERNALFTNDSLDSFEKAAMAGKKDGSAFVYTKPDSHESFVKRMVAAETNGQKQPDEKTYPLQEGDTTWDNSQQNPDFNQPQVTAVQTLKDSHSQNDKNLADLYQTIRENKAKATYESTDTSETPTKEFNFKIYRVDPKTREKILIPPGTKPEDFERMLAKNDSPSLEPTEKTFDAGVHDDNVFVQQMIAAEEKKEPNEKTYDGYVAIQEGDFDMTTWKNARQQNRLDFVNQDEVGAERE